MNDRVRRVDFYPADWLAGTAGLALGAFAKGVYWDLCALCYDAGRATLDEEVAVRRLSAMNGDNPRSVKAAIERLILAGKLQRLTPEPTPNGCRMAPELTPNRVRTELERASNRMRKARDNGAKGGRPRKQTNEIAKPNGIGDEKLSTINHQSSSINQHGGFRASDQEQRRIEDRVMEVSGVRDELKVADAVRVLLTRGCSGETIIEAAKIAGPKLRAVANIGSYLTPITAQVQAKRLAEGEPSDHGGDRVPPELLKRYAKACEDAEAKGLKLGDKGYPSLRDFGVAA